MKRENYFKPWPSLYLPLLLCMLCLTHCKRNDTAEEISFDSSKPVTVNDFYPKEGGAGSNLVIYGDNFGSDLSKVRVLIGGKPAKIVGVKSNSLYCIVPEGAYDGDIKIIILGADDAEIAQTISKTAFTYERKWLVSTLVGKYYQVSTDFQEKEGPFEDCGAFKGILWFTFDPKNPNHLYFSADVKAKIIRQFAQSLNPRGYLFLGASESLSSINADFEMIRCNPGIIYRKKT